MHEILSELVKLPRFKMTVIKNINTSCNILHNSSSSYPQAKPKQTKSHLDSWVGCSTRARDTVTLVEQTERDTESSRWAVCSEGSISSRSRWPTRSNSPCLGSRWLPGHFHRECEFRQHPPRLCGQILEERKLTLSQKLRKLHTVTTIERDFKNF